MKNRNLVINWAKKPLFPGLKKTIYETKPEKIPAAGNAPTYTMLEDKSKKVINNFKIIDATHRKAIEVNGQWETNDIEKAVREKSYEVYYNPDENLFISNIENNIACDAIKQLNAKFKLSIVKVIVNLNALSKLATNITNVVFQMKGPIRHIKQIAISGNNLANSNYFKGFAGNYDIKFTSASILFNNEELKVSISKSGWIHFFEDYPSNICLDFIIYLKKEGILSKSPQT